MAETLVDPIHPEGTVVAALTGYFDASGTPDKGAVLVVGGFISFEPRWLEFETRWNKALQKENVKIFHMTDFINGKNEFAGWKSKPRKQERLLNALGQIVVDSVVWNFASTVVLDDWRTVNQEYELEENDLQPYALAGWSCVKRTLSWCTEHVYAPPLFVFEHGDKHQDNLRRLV
jgi:hypothetical protein